MDIANSLQEYSRSGIMKPIFIKHKSREIQTIANVANKMISDISNHVKELKTFNAKLERQVQEKIQKEKKQEKMMIHQSRQAAMGEMLESIAHQWRQPLNVIGISVANLEIQSMLDKINNEELKEKLEIISLNTNYMSNTIDDFRNFLSPDSKKINFNPKTSIEEVFTILNAQLKNQHISYKIKEIDTIEFFAIENEFKQVIFVLINNAKDAILSKIENKEQDSGEILITIYKKHNKEIIGIEDNGGGIKTDIIESIFEPYFTTKFASQGTGIGLYIAKNIVESRMHGALNVKNTKGGCCFSIEVKNL